VTPKFALINAALFELAAAAATTAMHSAAACIPTPIPIGPNVRWIEVILEQQPVRLHEGQQVIATYAADTIVPGDPAPVTTPGVFREVEKGKGPVETFPGASRSTSFSSTA